MLHVRLAILILLRTTIRHWREKTGSYLLLVSIVAVGVGAFNGIRQASRSASANFGLFNQAISGQSDFLIESPTKTLTANELNNLRPLSGDTDWHLVPVISQDQNQQHEHASSTTTNSSPQRCRRF